MFRHPLHSVRHYIYWAKSGILNSQQAEKCVREAMRKVLEKSRVNPFHGAGAGFLWMLPPVPTDAVCHFLGLH